MLDQILHAIATAGTLLFLSRFFFRWLSNWRLSRLHGCQPAPAFRNPFPWTGDTFITEYNAAWVAGDRGLWMRRLLANPGLTTSASVRGTTWLVTAHPDNMREMLAHSASKMAVEPSRKPRVSSWIGDGIFVSDGERWHTSRTLFKPMFGRMPVSAGLDRFDVHANRFLNLLPKDGVTVDLQPMLKRLYLDVATELLWGRSTDSQLGPKASIDVERFERCWETAMFGMMRKIAQQKSRLMTLLKGEEKGDDDGDVEWRESCAFVHDVFDTHIDRVLRGKAEEEKNRVRQVKVQDEEHQSMLHRLVQQSRDRGFLRNQLLNVFVGARDTAGIGISDIFFHLARYPDVYARLRNEVLAIGEQPLTFELLKSMKYLQAVLAESIRLLSPVSTAIRHATSSFVLPRGGGASGESPVFVPAGSRLEINISALHQSRAYWGEDADEFLPDRWLPSTTSTSSSSGNHNSQNDKGHKKDGGDDDIEGQSPLSGVGKPWQYVPFLGGARICPAQQMMLTQYAFLLVRFCQRVSRMENRDPEQKFVGQIIFSLQSRNGVQVAVYR